MIIFSTVFKEKIWGGRSLETVLGKKLPSDGLFGESWEVSAHPHGLGVALNGKFKGQTLPEILSTHGEEILGTEISKKYSNKFPLLLKFLETCDKTSIQVHPSDEYAIPIENSFGKAECWYVISASDDAKLIMGIKDGISMEQYLQKTENNDFKNLFEEVSVKAGDLVVIKPGMVHATLEGTILICELQQNSDVTYRIYDFDRLENGVKRPLHTKKSADVIDFGTKADIRHYGDNTESELVLLDWEYFTLSRLIIDGTKSRPAISTMKLYSVLDGNFKLHSNGETLNVVKGDGFLLPANLEMTIEGKGTLLEAFPK